uniref:DUF4780 domain-containing protein n=1 Tax=Bracon brevicornis TaxID=1563983 RepID=A0A6V7JIP8_9HYME
MEPYKNLTSSNNGAEGAPQREPLAAITLEGDCGAQLGNGLAPRTRRETQDPQRNSAPAKNGEGVQSTDGNPLPTSGGKGKRSRSGAQRRKAARAKKVAGDATSSVGPQEEGEMDGAVPGQKRSRVPNETPPDARQPAKKRREVPGPVSYGQAVVGGSKAAIVAEGHPDSVLTPEQSQLVVAGLLEELGRTPLGETAPHFEGYRFEKGILWVTCSNQAATSWLGKKVESLRLKEGPLLKVLSRDALPKLSRMTAVLLAPDSGNAAILRLLKAQNPTLLTDKWRIWSKRTVGEHLHLVVGVDGQSKAALQALNMTPHYGLGRARFYETSGEGSKARPGKETEGSQNRSPSQTTAEPVAANPEGPTRASQTQEAQGDNRPEQMEALADQ